MPVPPPKKKPYDQWSPDARALDLVGDKWTLLIVRDLLAGPRRFVRLQEVLPGISTEQLRSRLNRMVAEGLLTRRRFREVPPRVEYSLTERASQLAPIIGELARWGYAWAWSDPREQEEIDIGAIFRACLGMLQSNPPNQDCQVEFRVDEQSYTFCVALGQVTLAERELRNTEALVYGSQADWVAALTYRGDPEALAYKGSTQLAHQVLNVVRQTSGRVLCVAA